ncbi:hypothetical protein INR49_018598 [Caranx melampygus]|nr:hypothetical protein INR49_018598 [Caranx melampygus]
MPSGSVEVTAEEIWRERGVREEEEEEGEDGGCGGKSLSKVPDDALRPHRSLPAFTLHVIQKDPDAAVSLPQRGPLHDCQSRREAELSTHHGACLAGIMVLIGGLWGLYDTVGFWLQYGARGAPVGLPEGVVGAGVVAMAIWTVDVAKLSKRVPGSTAVTDEDVQIAVMAKQELPSIMVGGRFYHLKDGSGPREQMKDVRKLLWTPHALHEETERVATLMPVVRAVIPAHSRHYPHRCVGVFSIIQITASKLGVFLAEDQWLPGLKRRLVVQTLGVTAPPPGLEEQQQN